MTKRSVFAILLFGALVAVGPAGCSRFKPSGPDAMGTMTFLLTATGSSGTVYRLRSATFMVSGPENKSIVSPTDPADTLPAITSQLRPGTYQIVLASGWQMWSIPMTGTPVAVPATLISPATLSFTVVSGQDSKVVYQFDVAGDALVPGTVTIGITVTEVDGGIDGSAGMGAAGTTGAAGGAAGAAGGAAGAAGGAAGAAGGAAGAAGGAAGAAGGAAGAAGGAAGAAGGAAGAAGGAAGAAGGAAGAAGGAAGAAGGAAGAGGAGGGTAVCGDHVVQPPEQCDDGFGGSATCSATCNTITPGSMCLPCEIDGSTAHRPASAVCLGITLPASTVVGCAALSTADARTKCMTLLACLQAHPSCSISPIDDVHMVVNNDPTACFCGSLDVASCAGTPASAIAGPCAATYFSIYGGVSNANRDAITGDFFAKATPTGMANNLYACDVNNNCQSKCP